MKKYFILLFTAFLLLTSNNLYSFQTEIFDIVGISEIKCDVGEGQNCSNIIKKYLSVSKKIKLIDIELPISESSEEVLFNISKQYNTTAIVGGIISYKPDKSMEIKLWLYIKDKRKLEYLTSQSFTSINSNTFEKAVLESSIELLDRLLSVNFSIHSNASPAEVYIDDKYYGHTPIYNIIAYKGKYTLKLIKDGYITNKKAIIVNNNNTEFIVKLEKDKANIPRNRITIRSILINKLIKQEKGFSVSFLVSYDYFVLQNLWIGDLSANFNIGAINFKRENTFTFFDKKYTTDKDINLIPISVGLKYTFLRDFHYIQPHIGIEGGIGMVSVYEDRYQHGQAYFGATAGISFHLGMFHLLSSARYIDSGKVKIRELQEVTPFGEHIKEDKDVFIGGLSFELGLGVEF